MENFVKKLREIVATKGISAGKKFAKTTLDFSDTSLILPLLLTPPLETENDEMESVLQNALESFPMEVYLKIVAENLNEICRKNNYLLEQILIGVLHSDVKTECMTKMLKAQSEPASQCVATLLNDLYGIALGEAWISRTTEFLTILSRVPGSKCKPPKKLRAPRQKKLQLPNNFESLPALQQKIEIFRAKLDQIGIDDAKEYAFEELVGPSKVSPMLLMRHYGPAYEDTPELDLVIESLEREDLMIPGLLAALNPACEKSPTLVRILLRRTLQDPRYYDYLMAEIKKHPPAPITPSTREVLKDLKAKCDSTEMKKAAAALIKALNH